MAPTIAHEMKAVTSAPASTIAATASFPELDEAIPSRTKDGVPFDRLTSRCVLPFGRWLQRASSAWMLLGALAVCAWLRYELRAARAGRGPSQAMPELRSGARARARVAQAVGAGARAAPSVEGSGASGASGVAGSSGLSPARRARRLLRWVASARRARSPSGRSR